MSRLAGRFVAPGLAFVVLLAFGACDRVGQHDRELGTEGGFALSGAFFTWDTARQAYLRVDLAEGPGGAHALSHHAVAGQTRLVSVVAEGEALVVLSPEARAVTVLGSAGEVDRRYDLGQPFNARSLSEDGRFLVAYTSAGAALAGGVAVGENLLSVVDLDAAPGETNPRALSVSSYGGARLGVDLSPEFLSGGSAHRLAVIRSEGHVALLDLMAPEAPVIGVPLVLPGDPVDLEPRAARFAVDEAGQGALWVFLTAPGSGDLITLRVSRAGEGGLQAVLNQHAVGGWVREALPLRDSAGQLFALALSDNARLLALIDVATGVTTSFQLELAYNRMSAHDIEVDGLAAPHVLLSRAGSDRFALLSLDEVASRGVKALRTRVLRTPYDELVPVPASPRLVAIDPEGERLTFVRLDREAAEDSVALAGVVGEHAFDASGERLLLLVLGAAGDDALVAIDTTTGAIAQMLLGASARRLHVLPDSGYLLVEHEGAAGHLSLVDPARFTPEEAESIVGFLLAGLLDGVEVQR